MKKVAIVGAGEAGTRAALALRENGYDGSITLIGSECHVPYERPPLSKPSATGVRLKAIASPDFQDVSRVSYMAGVAAQHLDPEVRELRLSDGTTVGYDRLLLATGSVPRSLTCSGADKALTFRTVEDSEAVFGAAKKGTRVSIVGAGLIGMELAAVLRERDVEVTVIEMASKPLGRAVPTKFADLLHRRHEDEGVKFRFGSGISEITDDAVWLDNQVRIESDLVVAAIGVSANTAVAETAGLSVHNGVQTDEYLQTSDPYIFAVGDCASVRQPDGQYRRSETWRNAREQAEIAVRNMLGTREAYAALHWFWSDQFDLGLQVVGTPLPHHEVVNRHLGETLIEFYLNQAKLVAAAGIGPMNSVGKDIRLAEMLIKNGIEIDPSKLSDPGTSLKSMLSRPKAA
ncbi:NAD(P)/FAD-dependent oxidoreductase [Rhizobium sp. NPDC090275]|uniref:NAD(P)/FAD-dependent oxidoreductase n=1 Tax=Rhizobium sp. NPDC090275 TaxID=3364498 RepID=UPI00383BEE58